MDIQVKVANKVASVIGSPVIVCGNSDYNISFDFDTEWEGQNVKTARFIYKKDGKLQFRDVVFSGSVAAVPVLSGIDEVYLGVYAGELHTTTPARILCKRSILCPNPEPAPEPSADVYKQLLEVINNIPDVLPTVTASDAGKLLKVNEAGAWAVGTDDAVTGLNKQLSALSKDHDAVWDAITEIQFGNVVNKADHAKSADNATHAETADNATHAETADTTTNATHAETADKSIEADRAYVVKPLTVASSRDGTTIDFSGGQTGFYCVQIKRTDGAGAVRFLNCFIHLVELNYDAIGSACCYHTEYNSTTIAGYNVRVRYDHSQRKLVMDVSGTQTGNTFEMINATRLSKY